MPSAQNQMPLAGFFPWARRASLRGMVLQQPVGQGHQIPEGLGVLIAGEGVVPHPLAQDIMGRRGHQALDVAAALLGDMAEGGRGRNGHPGRVQRGAEFRNLAEGRDDGHGALAVDGTGVVGEDLFIVKGTVAVLHGNHIAAEAGAARLHGHAAAGGLQGAAARKIPQGITAENGQDGGVAAGGQGLGHSQHAAQEAVLGQSVNGGLGCRFQRRLSVQLRQRIVRHAVADHKDILHGWFQLSNFQIFSF